MFLTEWLNCSIDANTYDQYCLIDANTYEFKSYFRHSDVF